MGESKDYNQQDRGTGSEYDRYFDGMRKTVPQKLAAASAHFLLDKGARIADMGCADGSSSYDLALLNPDIHVIGVDINETSIQIAQEKYQLPNLSFEVGDMEFPDFKDGPVDGIFNSSALHHVYTFNDYNRANIVNTLKNQLAALKDGGTLVLRDFVEPSPQGHVLLELNNTPSIGSSPQELSDADLLIAFAETARPLDQRTGGGFYLEELPPRQKDKRLFRLPHKWAAEFVLRKDYRANWDVELLEEYTFFTADDYRNELEKLGARVLHTAPYQNPWIVENRFKDQFKLYTESGAPLPYPATNFFAVAQKIPEGGTIRLQERRLAKSPASYLSLKTMTHQQTGQNWDIVSRPGTVKDVLPYYRDDKGKLIIYAKHAYPRPIANLIPRGSANLDGKTWSGHLVEGLSSALPQNPSDSYDLETLATRAGIQKEEIASLSEGLTFYPSPGGIDEIVSSQYVALKAPLSERKIDPMVSGFTSSGTVRGYDAQALLRSSQIGILPGARLERLIYDLLRRTGETPDDWIGAEISLSTAANPQKNIVSLADLQQTSARQAFSESPQNSNFLKVYRSIMSEETLDHGLKMIPCEQELEFFSPTTTSNNTAIVLPLGRDKFGNLVVGLEKRDLPTPQRHEGNSQLLCLPAWRLPKEVASLEQCETFLQAKFSPSEKPPIALGSSYFPSIGITPERAFPYLLDITEPEQRNDLFFVRLDELAQNIDQLKDGHTQILLTRAIHALGLWTTMHPTNIAKIPHKRHKAPSHKI